MRKPIKGILNDIKSGDKIAIYSYRRCPQESEKEEFRLQKHVLFFLGQIEGFTHFSSRRDSDILEADFVIEPESSEGLCAINCSDHTFTAYEVLERANQN